MQLKCLRITARAIKSLDISPIWRAYIIIAFCLCAKQKKNIKSIYCDNIVNDIVTEVLNTNIEYRRFA